MFIMSAVVIVLEGPSSLLSSVIGQGQENIFGEMMNIPSSILLDLGSHSCDYEE
jgi:hypothetical protein